MNQKREMPENIRKMFEQRKLASNNSSNASVKPVAEQIKLSSPDAEEIKEEVKTEQKEQISQNNDLLDNTKNDITQDLNNEVVNDQPIEQPKQDKDKKAKTIIFTSKNDISKIDLLKENNVDVYISTKDDSGVDLDFVIKKLGELNVEFKIMPTPTTITMSCGICVRMEEEKSVKEIIDNKTFEYKNIYFRDEKGYVEIQ